MRLCPNSAEKFVSSVGKYLDLSERTNLDQFRITRGQQFTPEVLVLGKFVVYHNIHLLHEMGKHLYLLGKRGGKHTALMLSRPQSGRTS